jgi:hypothetical protein
MQPLTTETFCYIAIEPCGCMTGVRVDNPEHRKDVALDVKEFISSGRAVERVTLKDAQSRHLGCVHREEHAKKTSQEIIDLTKEADNG